MGRDHRRRADQLGKTQHHMFKVLIDRQDRAQVPNRNLTGFHSGPIGESRLESLSEPGRPQLSLTGHKRIAAAIEQSNPRLAATAMRRHIKQTSDVALLRWQPPADEGGG